jgi:hypothetical protein
MSAASNSADTLDVSEIAKRVRRVAAGVVSVLATSGRYGFNPS